MTYFFEWLMEVLMPVTLTIAHVVIFYSMLISNLPTWFKMWLIAVYVILISYVLSQ